MPPPLALWVAVLASLVWCLAIMGTLIWRETRHTLEFDRRLAAARGQMRAVAPAVRERRRDGGGGRELRAFALTLLRAGSMLAPVGAAERESLSSVLRRAGFEQGDALSTFLCIKLAAAIVCAAGGALGAAQAGLLGGWGAGIAGVGGFVMGGVAPEYALRARMARRERRMGAALPDALDLMSMCLESGLTFERALATVAEELGRIETNLAREFRLMEAELRVGASRRAVLLEFQGRTEVEGLRGLAATLMQSDRYGTPLTQSMRNIAKTERDQRSARIVARAERLPVLMSLPMLLFVLPGTMLLVAGPAFLSAMGSLKNIGG